MARKIGEGGKVGNIDKKTAAVLGGTAAGVVGIAIKVIQALSGKK